MKIEQTSFHLTYCTNIHPGEEWQRVFANLQQYLLPLKARLAPERAFGIGLRLADIAARELLAEDNLAQFRDWLRQENLYVFTLNGFPFGSFHGQVVKDGVYAPDWREDSRREYTLRLVEILAALLPDGIDGSISTLPLSYKPWWQDSTDSENILRASSLNLAQVTAEMARIEAETGKLLHLDLEPEPDGLLENAAEVIAFFQDWLLPVGGSYLVQQEGISQSEAEAKLLHHIRVCYDTCHFAVEYEEPASVLKRFAAAGIKIGKIQLSAAIKALLPPVAEARSQLIERLRPFAESTYLHQVIARHNDRTLHRYRDLAKALPHLEKSTAQEWRTHFHVPIFIDDYGVLQSTSDHITELLALLSDRHCQHLEIETYTWEVLPPEIKLDLLASIEREYQWVLKTIAPQPVPTSV